MRHQSLWKRLKKLCLNILLFGIGFLVTIGILLQLNTVFTIHTIIVQGADSDGSLYGLSNIQGSSILFTSTDTIAKSIQLRNTQVEVLSVTKQYPHTITIVVTPRIIQAALTVSDGYYLLGNNGLIINRVKSINAYHYPLLSYYQQFPFDTFHAGDKLSYQDILLALTAIENARSVGLTPIRIDIGSFDVLALHTNDAEYRFSAQKDTGVQMYQFTTIVSRLREQQKKIKLLDVRFDKPVVQLLP